MQNDKLTDNLPDRFLDFTAQIMRMVTQLSETYAGKHISAQLFRSATSAGANYEKSSGAESRADFIHTSEAILKELKETRYWLLLIRKSELIKSEHLEQLIQESEELAKIIGKSVVTEKKE